jgi:Ca-activated chloride channel family protein
LTVTKFWRSNWRPTILFVLLIALGACFSQIPILAQDQGPGTIRLDVNLVVLDATVKTKDGQIMGDLKKENFEVREDGMAVLDLSDSIGPFLEPLRDAAATTLAALKPEDEVALFTFATEAELRTPLTKDKTKISEQISSFKAGGATNINDGIFVAAEYLLKEAPKGRRVIILISDDVGTDAGGQGTRDIVTETIAADAVLYNLKIPGYNSPQTIFAASMIPGLVNIRKVMDQTGGEIFDVQNVANLSAVFRALMERIKTRYTLGYYTSVNGAEGKPHKLDVRLAPSFGTKGRNYVILSKSGFYFR